MSDKTFLADRRLHEYVLDHLPPEPGIRRRLREETELLPNAIMQITPDQGEFLRVLIAATGAKKVLEVGVFTGYSSLCMALQLPEDGVLIGCDISDEYTAVARRYWREAGVAHKIQLRIAPAIDTLQNLLAEGHAGSFDFAFIDADKPSYEAYYEAALQLLRPGGLIVLDNMLQRGEVVDPHSGHPGVEAIRAMNDKISRDDRVTAALLPVADGMTLAVKRMGH